MTAIKGPFVFVSDGWARRTLTTDTLISRARTAGLKALALQLGNTPPSEAKRLKDAGFQIIGWGSQAPSASVTRARLEEIHADVWMPQAETPAEWVELERCIADGLHLLRPTEPVMTSGGMEGGLPIEVERRKRFAQDAGLRIVWVEVYVQESSDNPLRGDVEHMVAHFEHNYGFLKAYPVLGLWNGIPVSEYNLSKHGRSFGAWRFEQMDDERFREIASVPELSPPTQEKPMPGDPAKAVVLHAGSYVGEREVPLGSNRGKFVQECQSHTWLKGTGWPWCIAFIHRTFDEEGYSWPWKTAGAYDFYARGAKAGWAVKTPKPGDVAIWNIGAGHGSIVKTVRGNVVTTIDGNVSDQVKVISRPVSLARGFIRHPKFSKKATAPVAKAPLFQVVGSISGKRKVVFRGPRTAVGKWIAKTAIGKRFPSGVTIRRVK